MSTKPSIGLSTIIGWATFAGATITTAATAASGSEAQLQGPGKWSAILGIVALTITSAGRYLQAHALIKSNTALKIAGIGTELSSISEDPAPDVAGLPVATSAPKLGDQRTLATQYPAS
jgi:hypothetical protein